MSPLASLPEAELEPGWAYTAPLVPTTLGGSRLELDSDTRRHLEGVLRRFDGVKVVYTDGEGCHGSGVLDAGGILREVRPRCRRARA